MLTLLALALARATTPATYSADYSLPLGPVEVSTDDAGFGPRGAALTLVVFADFECPHCATTWRTITRFAAAHPGVRIAYKHYPLSDACNPEVEGARHEHACEAARAAVCAGRAGRFDELARLFFANQAFLASEDIAFMSAQAGLDPRAFSRCVDSRGALNRVREDVQAGIDAKIEGTPTLFLHGPWGDRWVRVTGLDAAFAAIAAAESGAPVPEPAVTPP